MKPLEYKTQHHPTTSSTLCRVLNIWTTNKTKKQTQSSADRITTSLSLAHQRKKTNKNSTQILPYKKLTQTTGPNLEGRNQKEERIQPWSFGKGDLKHSKLKKNNENAEKYYTNGGTN